MSWPTLPNLKTIICATSHRTRTIWDQTLRLQLDFRARKILR
jgi:hypothetical protein